MAARRRGKINNGLDLFPTNTRSRQAPSRGGGVITSGHVWAFIIIGAVFFVIVLGMATEPTTADTGGAGNTWRIESVHKGKVQVTSTRTGELQQIDDPALVRKCLNGQLKRGDVINW